jgi:hypothetical protein
MTLSRGVVVWRDGQYLGQAGHGQFLRCERPARPARHARRGYPRSRCGRPVMDARCEAWRWSAHEMAAAVHARRLSALRARTHALARLHAGQPGAERGDPSTTTPWTLAQAHDGRAATGAGETLPLAGVPITVKDNLWVQGRRITQGSRLFEDFVAPEDAWAVARMRDLGAVILGITNCSEFACKGVTNNLVYGKTRSPWNLALTPGGSSGGAASGTGAGIGALALATDAGGSTRRPAAHAGLVGMKPTLRPDPLRPGFRRAELRLVRDRPAGAQRRRCRPGCWTCCKATTSPTGARRRCRRSPRCRA